MPDPFGWNFRQIWTILDHIGPVWTLLDHFIPVWNHFGVFWTSLDHIGSKYLWYIMLCIEGRRCKVLKIFWLWIRPITDVLYSYLNIELILWFTLVDYFFLYYVLLFWTIFNFLYNFEPVDTTQDCFEPFWSPLQCLGQFVSLVNTYGFG